MKIEEMKQVLINDYPEIFYMVDGQVYTKVNDVECIVYVIAHRVVSGCQEKNRGNEYLFDNIITQHKQKWFKKPESLVKYILKRDEEERDKINNQKKHSEDARITFEYLEKKYPHAKIYKGVSSRRGHCFACETDNGTVRFISNIDDENNIHLKPYDQTIHNDKIKEIIIDMILG